MAMSWKIGFIIDLQFGHRGSSGIPIYRHRTRGRVAFLGCAGSRKPPFATVYDGVAATQILEGCVCVKRIGNFHFRHRQYDFSAGDVVIVPPRVDNRIEDDPASASSLYVCCIATSLFRFDDTLLGRLKTQCIRRDGHFANRVSSLMRRLVHEQSRAGRTRAVAMVSESLRLVQVISRRRTLQASPFESFKSTS